MVYFIEYENIRIYKTILNDSKIEYRVPLNIEINV